MMSLSPLSFSGVESRISRLVVYPLAHQCHSGLTDQADSLSSHAISPTLSSVCDIISSSCLKVINDNIVVFCNQYSLSLGQFINAMCSFYAINGTLETLDPNLRFLINDHSTLRQIVVPHAGMKSFFSALCPGVPVRNIMRSYADKTRLVLSSNQDIHPVYFRKYGMAPREIAFDFSDGCTSPPLTVRQYERLAKCRILHISDELDIPLVD